jgi:hypothetical protein
VAIIICPVTRSIDLCASVVAIAYWRLRESISKATVDAK